MSKGKIVAVCNQKGGVGKTTTAVNLSAFVAQKGWRVLLVDFDPQANATSGLGLDKREQERTAYQAMLGSRETRECIKKTELETLQVLSSNVALTGLEIELVNEPGREFKLRDALEPVRREYDFIVIDSPPSLGLLTLNALAAADTVLIPLQCEYYSLEGMSQLLETVDLVRQRINPALTVEGVVLTMADFRTRLTTEVIKEVSNFFKEKVYSAIIPRSIRLSESPGFGKPIFLYDRFSVGSLKYDQLAEEFINRQPKPERPEPAEEAGAGTEAGVTYPEDG